MKRLIIILVVVLVAFGVLVYYGMSRDDDSDSSVPSWVASLKGFSRDVPVSTADFMPPVNNFIVPQSAVMTYHIRSSDNSKLRTLRVELVTPGEAKLELQTLGETGMKIGMPLKSAGPRITSKLQIPKAGANLTITCRSSLPMQPCALRAAKQ